MRRLLLSFAFLAGFIASAAAQTSPNLDYHIVLTPAQWNALFASKQDVLGFTPMNVLGGLFLGRVVTAAPSSTTAGFSLTCGSAPSSPVNGDEWCTSSGFFVRINGATIGPLTAGSSGSFTGTAPIVPSFPGGGVVNYAINNGVSVANPGTGALEGILPVQTVTGASKTFATADLFKKTRRSNSGAAMSDTFPASTATGLVNGTRIVVANADATATDTITAGAGTVMASGGSTDTIGPGRDVAYEYDLVATQWRRAYNTGTALLGPNNLSDLSSVSTARTNLGLSSLYSVSAISHQWISSVTAGVPTLSQPAFSDISGVATGAQLPAPGASSLGGVFSKSCVSGGQFVQTINTDGTVNCVTPAGGGNVSNSGTPVANQFALWINSTQIQGVSAAAKSDQQTGTSAILPVTPSQQQQHDSAEKAWLQVTQSGGTYTNAANYNIASFSKTSTGVIVINFTTPFASTAFAAVCMANQNAGPAVIVNESLGLRTASQVTMNLLTTPNTNVDFGFSCMFSGRQ
jgi:hypothetical protein